MNGEVIVVGLFVLGAVAYVFRKAFASANGEKGSCRSCGDTCGCALKDAVEKSKRSK